MIPISSSVPPKYLGMLARVEKRLLSLFRVLFGVPLSMLLSSLVPEVGVFHGKFAWVNYVFLPHESKLEFYPRLSKTV